MTKLLLAFIAVFISQVVGSYFDIFGQSPEYEPRVAIFCGHVPFYIDLSTGKWTSDKTSAPQCDTNKEDVKSYCQKVYPKLNISNIVEANEKVLLQNWCKAGSSECNIEKKVVPYRCLVEGFEADALMVPKGCKFSHIHEDFSCESHDEWRNRAKGFCHKNEMKLNGYGMLVSCGTDRFNGVEFVCCPRHHKQHKTKHVTNKKKKPEVDRVALEAAVKEFEKFLPELTQGCDRTMYEKKREKLEERHQTKIAAVVDEWDEAEARYKKIKSTNLSKAQEKMRKTLKVFRETLAALEEKAKEERTRLKTEHANCIQMNINKQKRDAMLAYLLAVQEKPHSIRRIIRTARKFFQVCEHDRLHSLRHFQHVRKQQPETAEKFRKSLLNHLQHLNDIVNKSMSLLSHLPDVAEKLGLNTIFKPEPIVTPEIIKTEPPTEKPLLESHKNIPERILKMIKKMKADEKKYEELEKLRKTEKIEPVTVPLLPDEEVWPLEMTTERPEELLKTEQPMQWPEQTEVEPATTPGDLPATTPGDLPATEELDTTTTAPVTGFKEREESGDNVELHEVKHPVIEDSFDGYDGNEKTDDENSTKKKLSKNTLNPTDNPPKTFYDNEGLPEDEHAKPLPSQIEDPLPPSDKLHHKKPYFKHLRSPAAFAAVIGLSCGALVIMLGIIVALVMRRNRASQARVYFPDAEPEDHEHLVKMQKSGYENPTYKFFYY